MFRNKTLIFVVVYNDFCVYNAFEKVISRISKYAEIIQCQPTKENLAYFKIRRGNHMANVNQTLPHRFVLNAKVSFDTGCCLNKAKHIGIKHNHAKPKVMLGSSARAASSLPWSNSRLPHRSTKKRRGNVWLYFKIFQLITFDYLLLC